MLPGVTATPVPLAGARSRTTWLPWVARAAWIAGSLAALAGTAVAIATLDNGRQKSHVPMPLSATFTRLTSHAGIEDHPSLSPDGKWIVYSAPTAAGQHIFLQSVGGQNRIDLTNDASSNDTQPAFSPDGEQIAFRLERLGGGIFVHGSDR